MRAAVLLTLAALSLAPLASGQDATAAKDPTNFTWVEERVLAVGGGGLTEADVDTLHALGFRAIADLRAEHTDPASYIEGKAMSFFDMPIDSASDINATQFAAFVDWAQAEHAAGRPIYIHCTNGWHRAAAFAVAWHMATDGDTYDEGAREQVTARAGTVMRAVSGLLDYEATLAGSPQVAVTLSSAISHPGYNATMPVHVDVVAGGAPAANARVIVWSEESKIKLEGTTDANGRFTFTYTAPKAGTFMDHLYARASVEGYVDGADNVEFIFAHAAKTRGALDIEATFTTEGIQLEATSGGKPVPARFVLTAPGWSAFESSAIGTALITDAPAGATITVRAVSWGSEGGAASVQTAAPPPPVQEPPIAEPPPVVQPPPIAQPPVQGPPVVAPQPEPQPEPQPSRYETGRALAERYGIVALAAVATLLAGYVLARRRSGVGSK